MSPHELGTSSFTGIELARGYYELLDELLQDAREKLRGVRVILADDEGARTLEWGDICDVRLDHEHVLLFGVHLIQPGDLLAEEPIWLSMDKLFIED